MLVSWLCGAREAEYAYMLMEDLSDPATRTVTGIIDFGDVTIGDPDYELQWLYADYGERFLQTYLAVNPHPCPDRLRRKLRFFDRASTLDDALIGLRRDDQEIVETALAQLGRQTGSP